MESSQAVRPTTSRRPIRSAGMAYKPALHAAPPRAVLAVVTIAGVGRAVKGLAADTLSANRAWQCNEERAVCTGYILPSLTYCAARNTRRARPRASARHRTGYESE